MRRLSVTLSVNLTEGDVVEQVLRQFYKARREVARLTSGEEGTFAGFSNLEIDAEALRAHADYTIRITAKVIEAGERHHVVEYEAISAAECGRVYPRALLRGRGATVHAGVPLRRRGSRRSARSGTAS